MKRCGRRTLPVVALLCLCIAQETAFAFDHSEWDRLLQTHVDPSGQVAYKDLFTRDLEGLQSYLNLLASAQPEGWSDAEQIAFWINAYNAGTIFAIHQGRSAESLLGRAKLFKFWKFEVAGRKRSLDEIEHSILRQQFDEPRIHFAIVCASTSCPQLRNEAYVAEKLHEQLESQASAFINDSMRNQIDRGTERVRLSKIFDWFREDFEGQGSVLEFIADYVDDTATRDWLQDGTDAIRIEHLDYDWSLNAQSGQRPR